MWETQVGNSITFTACECSTSVVPLNHPSRARMRMAVVGSCWHASLSWIVYAIRTGTCGHAQWLHRSVIFWSAAPICQRRGKAFHMARWRTDDGTTGRPTKARASQRLSVQVSRGSYVRRTDSLSKAYRRKTGRAGVIFCMQKNTWT